MIDKVLKSKIESTFGRNAKAIIDLCDEWRENGKNHHYVHAGLRVLEDCGGKIPDNIDDLIQRDKIYREGVHWNQDAFKEDKPRFELPKGGKLIVQDGWKIYGLPQSVLSELTREYPFALRDTMMPGVYIFKETFIKIIDEPKEEKKKPEYNFDFFSGRS